MPAPKFRISTSTSPAPIHSQQASTTHGSRGSLVDSVMWDERYGGADFVCKTEPNQFLVAELTDTAPGRALGSRLRGGSQRGVVSRARWQVTGVDFSPVGLAKARRLAKDHDVDVQWVEADVVAWEPLGAAFDLVIIFYLHLPATERRRVLAHVQDALAPGATLLVVGHDATNLTHGYGGPQYAPCCSPPRRWRSTWTRCALCEPIMWNAALRPIGALKWPSTRWCAL